MKEAISRRSFITAGAGFAALGALSLCGAAKTAAYATPIDEIEWDEETDVVVMGFGGSGAATAIGAAEAGAEVMVFEKAPEGQEGGNTSVSGGGAHTKYVNFPDFIYAQFPDTIKEEEIEGFLTDLGELDAWAEDRGYTLGSKNGFGLFGWLKDTVAGLSNIQVFYETPVKRLIFDPETKEVFGVVVERDGEETNVKAKRGVVMACGGFENNHEMLTAYYPPSVPIFADGSPYNTGDGIPIVAEIGAKLRGFSSVEWGCHCCKAGSEEIGVALAHSFMNPDSYQNSIVVNRFGKRFVNESSGGRYGNGGSVLRPLHAKEQIPELAMMMTPYNDEEGNYVNVTFEYENLPMYLIFGETRMNNGQALFTGAGKDAMYYWSHLHDLYTWSDTNQDELEKGWIIKADTLEELAEKMGIDPEGLAATVVAYDAACEAGVDEEFGRSYDLTPVGEGPFYACELAMSLINTQGGPTRDASYHVINNDDQVVPRLYAVGEFGSIFVFNYPGALNVAEALSANVAGTNVAAEDPWC